MLFTLIAVHLPTDNCTKAPFSPHSLPSHAVRFDDSGSNRCERYLTGVFLHSLTVSDTKHLFVCL